MSRRLATTARRLATPFLVWQRRSAAPALSVMVSTAARRYSTQLPRPAAPLPSQRVEGRRHATDFIEDDETLKNLSHVDKLKLKAMMDSGDVISDVDMEKAVKDRTLDDELLPDFEGGAVERCSQGLVMAKEVMQKGHIAAALNMTEAALRRAYREGTSADKELLDIVAEGHLIAGTVRQRMGNWEAALVHLDAAVQNNPQAAARNPAFYYGQGASNAVLGNLSEALAAWSLCSVAVDEDPSLAAEMPWLRVVLPINIGQTLLRMNKPDAGLDSLIGAERAIADANIPEEFAASARPAVHYYRALCLATKGEHPEACASWHLFDQTKGAADEELLEAKWKERWLQHSVRSLFLAASAMPPDSPKAVEWMDRANAQTLSLIEECPDYGRGWWLRGDCLHTMGDAEGALAAYMKVLDCEDSSTGAIAQSVRVLAGRCLLDLKRPSEAEAMFEEELKQPNPDRRATAGLAAALCEQGGEERLARADAIVKEQMEALRGKESDEAKESKADLTTVGAQSAAQRGESLEDQEKMLLQALGVDPGNPRAQSLLQQVRQQLEEKKKEEAAK